MSLEEERMQDRKRLEEGIAAQDYVAETYSSLANRCSTPQIKMTFLNLLGEEHRIQNDLVSEQLRRGWKTSIPADPNEITELLEDLHQRKKNAFQ